MFSKFAAVGLGGIGERIVGPIHQRVLAEHGSHDYGLCDGDLSKSWVILLDAQR